MYGQNKIVNKKDKKMYTNKPLIKLKFLFLKYFNIKEKIVMGIMINPIILVSIDKAVIRENKREFFLSFFSATRDRFYSVFILF